MENAQSTCGLGYRWENRHKHLTPLKQTLLTKSSQGLLRSHLIRCIHSPRIVNQYPEYQNPLLKVLTARLYTILPPNLKLEIPPGTYETKKLSSAAICTIADINVKIVECNYH
jgi:hypothetical protein